VSEFSDVVLTPAERALFPALNERRRAGPQRWHRRLIVEGLTLVEEWAGRRRPGPYQIQAAVNAVHCAAPTASETDSPRIVHLYHAFG
jgi:RNA polymerase sigma-70 factor (ECF subfamily)